MNAQDIEKTAADWLAQKTGGEWSADDQARLDAWIASDLAHRIAYIRLEAVWKKAEKLTVLRAAEADSTVPPVGSWDRTRFLNVNPEMQGDLARVGTSSAPSVSQLTMPANPGAQRRSRSWTHTAAAASVVLAITAALYLWYAGWPAANRYTTPIGHISNVELSDGSRVTLNTDSRIRVAFNAHERRIELDQGEAFFNAAKDPSRPFVVQVEDRRVVAVGTAFSVRRADKSIRVAVTEGKVRLESANGAAATARTPGARAAPGVLIEAGGVAETSDAEVALKENAAPQVEQLLSWRQGYLVFRRTALADAVAELNRYNERKIVIADPAIATIQIGGNFRSNNTDTFLWMLETGFPVTVDKSDSEVILRAR